MRKADRQDLIRRIIINEKISRQDDLVAALRRQNVSSTQATISRDIKELHLDKVPDNDGGYRYALPSQRQLDTQGRLAVELSNNLVKLKRHAEFLSMTMRPGNGPMMADLMRSIAESQIFTAVGDDSTVLVVCYSDSAAEKVEEQLHLLMNQ